jgi:hypothetical protein
LSRFSLEAAWETYEGDDPDESGNEASRAGLDNSETEE